MRLGLKEALVSIAAFVSLVCAPVPVPAQSMQQRTLLALSKH
jgi:hypothetical protein